MKDYSRRGFLRLGVGATVIPLVALVGCSPQEDATREGLGVDEFNTEFDTIYLKINDIKLPNQDPEVIISRIMHPDGQLTMVYLSQSRRPIDNLQIEIVRGELSLPAFVIKDPTARTVLIHKQSANRQSGDFMLVSTWRGMPQGRDYFPRTDNQELTPQRRAEIINELTTFLKKARD